MKSENIKFPDNAGELDSLIAEASAWPFKKVGKEKEQFNLSEQIEGCAKLIYAIKTLAGDELWATFKNSGERKETYARILKKAFKDAIRISGESLDYKATVDFISRRAMQAIQASSGTEGKVSRKHILDTKNLHHEHMVPGEELCREIVASAASEENIRDILDAGSSRALIVRDKGNKNRCEKNCVDSEKVRSQGVPAYLDIGGGVVLYKSDIPEALRGLFRYHCAGLIDELVPVSDKGRQSLERYRDVVRLAVNRKPKP